MKHGDRGGADRDCGADCDRGGDRDGDRDRGGDRGGGDNIDISDSSCVAQVTITYILTPRVAILPRSNSRSLWCRT